VFLVINSGLELLDLLVVFIEAFFLHIGEVLRGFLVFLSSSSLN